MLNHAMGLFVPLWQYTEVGVPMDPLSWCQRAHVQPSAQTQDALFLNQHRKMPIYSRCRNISSCETLKLLS